MWPVQKAVSIAILGVGAYCVWGVNGDIALVIGLILMFASAMTLLKSFDAPTGDHGAHAGASATPGRPHAADQSRRTGP